MAGIIDTPRGSGQGLINGRAPSMHDPTIDTPSGVMPPATAPTITATPGAAFNSGFGTVGAFNSGRGLAGWNPQVPMPGWLW